MWKDIRGFPNYKVSNKGLIKNQLGIVLKPFINKRGYCYVGLYNQGKRKQFLVHRLVAIHYLDNPKNYPCINHKDSNPSNNYYKNLEWCNHQMNTDHYINKGRSNPPSGERAHSSKLTETDVLKIKKMLSNQISQYQIAKLFNVYQSTISDIKNNVTWKEI